MNNLLCDATQDLHFNDVIFIHKLMTIIPFGVFRHPATKFDA